jgi:hypothetical protein
MILPYDMTFAIASIILKISFKQMGIKRKTRHGIIIDKTKLNELHRRALYKGSLIHLFICVFRNILLIIARVPRT